MRNGLRGQPAAAVQQPRLAGSRAALVDRCRRRWSAAPGTNARRADAVGRRRCRRRAGDELAHGERRSGVRGARIRAVGQGRRHASSTAAGETSFTLTAARRDGEQYLNNIDVALPSGLLGRIAGVAQCGEAAAAAGTWTPARRSARRRLARARARCRSTSAARCT